MRSEVLGGKTISYEDVFGEEEGLALRRDGEEASYDLTDYYCMNPACACEETVLIFTENTEHFNPDSREFAIRYSINDKEYELLDSHGLQKSAAEFVVNHNVKGNKNINKRLKKRYKDMKAKGREVLNAFSENSEEDIPQKKLKRNDPCFCGSGKKYKKCCG